ncbi:Oidioi.mRNA.OKI2018_I69.chr1.g402.t1.cds [Oikopleura dioica]|uniref:Oidioi.mRNA.OKI2018_I69.chr1.g402.t1.cds n=1 Tax=Oikopleura dioica TaxID=34765 RepID=A0ABN7SU07_OIKDI|nr:Oidioi.mRNA.OKI2018_I69.chr1.g402.t1.cds [Oikopleura dioica]
MATRFSDSDHVGPRESRKKSLIGREIKLRECEGEEKKEEDADEIMDENLRREYYLKQRRQSRNENFRNLTRSLCSDNCSNPHSRKSSSGNELDERTVTEEG